MVITSRWVLPIDRPPLARGWVEVSGQTIVAVGTGPPPAPAHDLGDAALLPGLVNAHTHLELSWMAGRVPPAPSMDAWIRGLLSLRRAGPAGGEAEILRAARAAIRTMLDTGTVLVGDVSNSLVTPALLHEAGLDGVVFHELLGFSTPSPGTLVQSAVDRIATVFDAFDSRTAGTVRARVVAHAPYSVSPGLFREIGRRESLVPLTVHLGESPEEIQFLHTGDGPIRDLLSTLGVWDEAWVPPACNPVEYIDVLGYLQPGLLAVHATHLSDDALARLRAAEAVIVTCPRSNVWIGVGLPRVSHFYSSGAPVAIGTDSLASVGSLNLFDELAELRRISPDVAASALLDSATRVGARALGFGNTHGTIAAGKRAALVAVDVPPDVRDVEEYLVGGVPASAVRRIS